MLQALKTDDLEFFCILSWAIWSDRNKSVFANSSSEAIPIVEDSFSYLREFQRCQLMLTVKSPANCDTVKRWQAPPLGKLKLNVDAAFNQALNMFSVGGIIRDSYGSVFAAFTIVFNDLVSPLVGECVAIREGLNFVASLGLKVDLVETDAVNAITSIAKQQFQGIHGPVVSDICNFLASTNSKCCWIPRDANEAAHSVAKFGLVSKKSVV